MMPTTCLRMKRLLSKCCGKVVPAAFDDLLRYLPNLSWGEVFVAVDQMSRDGRLLIRRRLLLRPLGNSSYQITLPSQLTSPRSPSRQEEAHP